MHPLENCYVGGISDALTSFGMAKEALSPEEKSKMLEAYRARPKGIAAVSGAAPVKAPAGGLELNRSGYQGGYGTAGTVPGASINPRGQISGLPGKMASLFL